MVKDFQVQVENCTAGFDSNGCDFDKDINNLCRPLTKDKSLW